mmetsp:Transcript_73806/g.123303  ORF Transcript_73806/g.123303 Transcript_73806/m.123303 type:complete len:779 (-) Transcript_73806:405-2741(-)
MLVFAPALGCAFAITQLQRHAVAADSQVQRHAKMTMQTDAKMTSSSLLLDPEIAAKVLEGGPQASQGPFGKGGMLEWVATATDMLAAVTLSCLHAFDDKAVQDSSKNLQVLWSRAVLAHHGQLKDDVAIKLLPASTRGVISAGALDFTLPLLEWVQSRTDWLDTGCNAFLSSPTCANADSQIVIFGAGFDTRSIRYQRDRLRVFEVDLPDTIEAKRCVHQRYKNSHPGIRLPTLVGWDLSECEHASLLSHLETAEGFRRDLPTMFISEAVMFYVPPRAIANLYFEIFSFGATTEAMYSFTDSMRPFVQGPFSDESASFFRKQGVELLAHTARWSGAVQFCHAVACTKPDAVSVSLSLREYVRTKVEAPINSYAPERKEISDLSDAPSFNDKWYAIAFTSQLTPHEPYATRLFGEAMLLLSDDKQQITCTGRAPDGRESSVSYVAVEHQGLIWLWRGDEMRADKRKLPTHPTPEMTHTVETVLDYGCDWKYIVENNLDTPHLYWLHDGSIPPIESLGCNRENVDSIGLRFFKDDIGIGHIGKTKSKVTKVVRFDSPNVVRHGGVSGFSEEFNIVPIGPHRTRVLLRQRFPKGPILSTLLGIPGSRGLLQYLVRNWNYQIALEDYSVMQGQAHNIDDFGAPNWKATSVGDDLIVKFWKWKRRASQRDGPEYFTRWDGSTVETTPVAPLTQPAKELRYLAPRYIQEAPIAEYPPINRLHYQKQQAIWEPLSLLPAAPPALRVASAAAAFSGLATATILPNLYSQGVVQAVDLANSVTSNLV